MEKKRKIAMVVKKVSFEEEEDSDLFYWSEKSAKERLIELADWNKKVWRHLLKDKYPEKIEMSGGKQIKALTDEDDF